MLRVSEEFALSDECVRMVCVSAGWCRKRAGAEREKETRFALLQVVVRAIRQTLLAK